jgi:hypothetical protein
MTISSIGTSGTYTTIQSWEDACPSDITASGTNEDWIGELKNQEFTITSTITISGMTTDSTHRVILRTESGASFRDNANKTTNKLTYNSSYGAGIYLNTGYVGMFNTGSKHVTLYGIMIHSTNSSPLFTSQTNTIIDSCILIGPILYSTYNQPVTIQNSVIRTSGGGIESSNTHINNTFIAKTASSYPFGSPWYGSVSTFTNCLFLGYTDFTNNYTVTNCGTTGAFGSCTATSCITGLTASSEIEAPAFGDSTVANMDARLKSGASSISAGTSSGAPSVDIIGQSRS